MVQSRFLDVRSELTQTGIDYANEIQTKAVGIENLIERICSDEDVEVDWRWLDMARNDLMRGLLELERAILSSRKIL